MNVVAMDNEVELLTRTLSDPPPKDHKQKVVKMLCLTAEKEDSFFEKTGVEHGYYSHCA